MGCCTCFSSALRKPFVHITSLGQVGCAVAIICIIYFHLTDFDYTITTDAVTSGDVEIVNYSCALGTIDDGDDLCVYGYIAAGVSLGASLLLMISSCICCLCWGFFDIWVDWVFTLAGTLWWGAAGIVMTANNSSATSDGFNAEDVEYWRNVVTILCWVLTLLFFLQFIVAQIRLCYKVCGCCGGRADREQARAKEQARKDEEAAKMAAVAAAAASAAVAAQAQAGDAAVQVKTAGGDVEAGKGAAAEPANSSSRSFFGFGKKNTSSAPIVA